MEALRHDGLAGLAKALKIGFGLYFHDRRLALWPSDRGVRNGFVSLFFAADRANARMESQRTPGGDRRDRSTVYSCLL